MGTMARMDPLLCAACLLLVTGSASGAEPGRSTRAVSPRQDTSPPIPPSRRAEFGLDTGLARRPAQGTDVSYGTGILWGGHVRLPLASWLGFRATAANSQHRVTLRRGALGLANTEVHQPDLSTLVVSARLEPTWQVSRSVSLWAGPEIGWTRTSADEPTTRGDLVVRTAARHAVGIELGGSGGALFEVVPNWILMGMSVGTFFVMDQGGSLYDRVQGFDQDGHMLHVGPYPKFAGSFRTLVGIGVLL